MNQWKVTFARFGIQNLENIVSIIFFSRVALQGGSGYVRAVRYQNVRMENVSNPIIIDQFYCDSPSKCEDQVSYICILIY